MKQGHSMEMFMQYDTLMEGEDEKNDMKSNFIEYLREEKMNNRTLDFKQVYQQLEPLAFSYPLVVVNKKKIIAKLLGFLKADSNVEGS
jgi:hypothetical protein